MPVNTPPAGNSPAEETFRCTIKHMFRGCPKDDGWFGCFAHIHGSDDDIKLTGITNVPLADGMQLDVKATKSGDDYKIKEFTIVTKTRTGLVSYLASLPGVSRITAISLVTAYGEHTVEKILEEPDTVQDEIGLNTKQINALKNGLLNGSRLNLLRQQFPELSAQQIKRISAMMVNPILEISDNPYCLTDIPGISFQIADAIGQRLNTDPRSPFRINHGLVHVLKTNYADELFVNLDDVSAYTGLIANLQTLLKLHLDPSDVAQRLTDFAAIEDSPIVIERYKNEAHLYLKSMYNDMISFINNVHDLNGPEPLFSMYNTQSMQQLIGRFEMENNMRLTDEQKHAAETALKNRISIITGGPGRGKTSMIKCIASCWPNAKNVLLLAPTGKAMNKLKNATGGGDPDTGGYTAMTVDRLLVMSLNLQDDGYDSYHPKKFRYNSQIARYSLHMDECLFIIDESSMLDLQKTAALFNAFPLCHYVFVGDIDQLPPISPGHILKEMIACGKIPVARLTKPLRNGGLILSNADKVNNNDTSLQYRIGEFLYLNYENDSEEALDLIINAYNTERENVLDIQQLALLCPVRKGIVGTNNLNIKIKDLICPKVDNAAPVTDTRKHRGWMIFSTKGFEIPNTFYGMPGAYTKFRVGDIVMNTKNNYQIETITYDHNDYWNGDPSVPSAGIFNGDCGKIIAYVPNMVLDKNGDTHEGVVVQFFDGRVAQLDLVMGEFEPFELGYAITVHKSQGCEYDSIIYVSPQSVERLTGIGFATRNLVYTAITRAKQRVMIVGSKSALNACITTNATDKKSTIHERI